jgi:uncharacterized integral membrane protein
VVFLILVVFLLIGGLMAIIAVLNITQPIPLDLFFWKIPDLPFGLYLGASFLCGAIVLYLVSVFSALRDRRNIKALQKQVHALEAQITSMSQASSPSADQVAGEGLSSADKKAMMPMPGVMSTPPPEGRMPSSPLQQFH